MTPDNHISELAARHEKQAIKDAELALRPSQSVWVSGLRTSAIQHFQIAAALRALTTGSSND